VDCDEISDVLYQRLCCRWRSELLANLAVPVVVLGVRMFQDEAFGQVTICTLDHFTPEQIASFLDDVSAHLRQNGFDKGPPFRLT